VSAVRERSAQKYSVVFGLGAKWQELTIQVHLKLAFGFLAVKVEDVDTSLVVLI